MIRPLYVALATLVQARLTCIATDNTEWLDRHTDRLTAMVKEALPSGSGFDAGTTLDLDRSTPSKLVFLTSYHHMDAGGSYDGWTEHVVTVTPSLTSGFDLKVSGKDRDAIKTYIGGAFDAALSGEVTRDGRPVAFIQPAYYAQEAQGGTEIIYAYDAEATPLVDVPLRDEGDPEKRRLHKLLVDDLLSALNRRALADRS